MNRFVIITLLLLAACSGSQRVAYEGAQKGNIVVGRYFGANAKDLFHTAEQGLMHFDGSAWTQVPGVDAVLGGQFVSAGAGKVWLLSGGKLERIDAGGMRQDFTSMVNADGPPLSVGRGNGEVMVCAGNVAMKRFFIYRLNGETFERVAGPSSEEFSFELIRGRDDAFLRSPLPLPAIPFFPVASYVGTPTPLAWFDGSAISGPLFVTGNSNTPGELKSVSGRVPKSEGVLGAFTFDGAWLHASGRPSPGGFFYWRSDDRLGVLANLYGAADWTPTYAVAYDPATGQYGSALLDVNSEAEVNYWTAAWNGTGWVDQQKLFKSTACVGVTCGGSRTGFAGELDDGTLVAAGPDDSQVAGIWFVTP